MTVPHSPKRWRAGARPFSVTAAGQFDAWQAGQLPTVEALGRGLWSIPVPLPLDTLRYVLVYALELPAGLALVDAGWDTDEAWVHLTSGLASFGAAVSDVQAVAVTHLHPDHYGLAGRVREVSGAWVGLHPADAELIVRHGAQESTSPLAGIRRVLRLSGVPESELGFLDLAVGLADGLVKVRPDRLIEDGDRLPLAGWNLRAVHTPGHSPGHLCFHEPDRKLLLTGDHLLPRITPNIGVSAMMEDTALAQFIDSLHRVAELDDDVDEVLPAHEYRFAGAAARAQTLIHHRDQRLTHLYERLEAPMTGWQLAQRLEWSRPWEEVTAMMRPAAVAETMAHLVLLERYGRVRRRRMRGSSTSAAGAEVPWLWERCETVRQVS